MAAKRKGDQKPKESQKQGQEAAAGSSSYAEKCGSFLVVRQPRHAQFIL